MIWSTNQPSRKRHGDKAIVREQASACVPVVNGYQRSNEYFRA
jgi:hypothetical protein